MADATIGPDQAHFNVSCPTHPALFEAPAGIACPWCAQEARRRAYARQRADGAARLAEAARRFPRLGTAAHGCDVPACANTGRCANPGACHLALPPHPANPFAGAPAEAAD